MNDPNKPVGDYVMKSCYCNQSTNTSTEEDGSCERDVHLFFKTFDDRCPKNSEEKYTFGTREHFSAVLYAIGSQPEKLEEILETVHKGNKRDGEGVAFSKVENRRNVLPFVFYPAQLRAIVYPMCEQENSVYFQCAQNAYRGRDREPGCFPKSMLPKSCYDGSFDWLK